MFIESKITQYFYFSLFHISIDILSQVKISLILKIISTCQVAIVRTLLFWIPSTLSILWQIIENLLNVMSYLIQYTSR